MAHGGGTRFKDMKGSEMWKPPKMRGSIARENILI